MCCLQSLQLATWPPLFSLLESTSLRSVDGLRPGHHWELELVISTSLESEEGHKKVVLVAG